MNAKTIYHIYLGVRSADAEGRFGTAPLFLGARECRAVERAQDFGLELISALSASDAVVLTGAFEPGEVWPPIPIIGAAYRLYCGVDLLDSGVAHLSEGGVICAGKIDFRGKPLYLVPDNPSIEALSYALISRELNLPSRGAYAPAPVQIFPEAASAVQYTPEPMGTPVVCGPQYPYAEREKLEPWDDEIFSQMWGHPIFPEETGAEPFEPYMPEEFQENYLERVSERMQNAPRLRAEPPRESAAHIEAEDSMAAAFIEAARIEAARAAEPSRESAEGRIKPQIRRGQIIHRAMLSVACLMFFLSLGYLTYHSLESSAAKRQSEAMAGYYRQPEIDTAETAPAISGGDAAETPDNTPDMLYPSAVPEMPDTAREQSDSPMFAELIAMNPDVVGWIHIPGTQVNYPVLQSPDSPNFYLTHDFYKQNSRLGAIYADGTNNIQSDRNITVYGHHAKAGTMFGELKSYLKLDFYKKNPAFTFDTPEEKGQWAVFSVFTVTADMDSADYFEWRTANFSSEEEFLRFIDECKSRSVVNTAVDIAEGDDIMNLATCSYEFEDARLVVMARRMRPGEIIDTEAAAANTENSAAWTN